MDKYYKEWTEKKIDKTTGLIKTYPDGTPKTRVITPSMGKLKELQKLIKKNILDSIIFPEYIQGGVKGRSNITNAKLHQGKKYKFTTDLKDFFPRISNKQVNKVFIDLGYSQHCAHFLTKLCTYKGHLPQGIPVSTHIANLAFLPTDKLIIHLLSVNKITYSRFVDDITISSQSDFQSTLQQVLNTIKSGGFSISYRKTSYAGIEMITGIRVFNNNIDAPKKIKEAAKLEIDKDIKPYTRYLEAIQRTNNPKK
ncbi:reverse transcriptase family protein [Dyadobacter sp. CY351]|uniref:reverse transcriptase family protein n=1 Tax=Dyadobacter sp. CY351 TaxID=2909337 RepID=UPI001F29AC00|nr:reverse transcriptase family protein [Dyadobacter sp. CY351]MCF2521079.1 reverse transcriptase family protein [Dyadobacter sp. CY351]